MRFGTIQQRLDCDQARHRLAVARDRHVLSAFNAVEQAAELFLGVNDRNRLHWTHLRNSCAYGQGTYFISSGPASILTNKQADSPQRHRGHGEVRKWRHRKFVKPQQVISPRCFLLRVLSASVVNLPLACLLCERAPIQAGKPSFGSFKAPYVCRPAQTDCTKADIDAPRFAPQASTKGACLCKTPIPSGR